MEEPVSRMVLPIGPYHFNLTEAEIVDYSRDIQKILKSRTLVLGEVTREFEEAFAALVGTKHAISCNSGSTALEILLRCRDIQNRTVLVPTNTNFATVAAVLRVGAKVQFVDMVPATFAPSSEIIEEHLAADSQIAGVLWVHIGGIVSPEFPGVVALCRERSIFIFEDAAHAHGSALRGIKAGNLADGAAFSFFCTKVLTTFEGGMITTNSDHDAKLARSLRNQGKGEQVFGGLHHVFGNSWRITEAGALLGLMQLRKLPQNIKLRHERYSIVTQKLRAAGIDHVRIDHMDTASHYKLIVLTRSAEHSATIKKRLAEGNITVGAGVYDVPCHRQPVFASLGKNANCPNADEWCPRHVCPPITAAMSIADSQRVGDALVHAFSSIS